MKTLYISDLDGTLFNSEEKITKFTANVLNKFIEQGGLFTIATARMAYDCDYKLNVIKLNIPGIVMNGACLYSFSEKKYVDVKTIETTKVAEIENVLDEFDIDTFMYCFDDNTLNIYYKKERDNQDTQYLSKRAQEECKEIKKVDNLLYIAKKRQVIYFALTDKKEKIQIIWDKIRRIDGIESIIYLNVYNGLYCLEIFDVTANKANALINLKRLLQVEEIIVFGDNHNDIDMMKAADFCFAPKNAVSEVKRIANGIIESCDNDGVAKYIQYKYEL